MKQTIKIFTKTRHFKTGNNTYNAKLYELSLRGQLT